MNADQRIDTTTLGLLLNSIGTFDIDKFSDRLRMQKSIYLLQSFGVDLGYEFYWYIHGVYSKELSKDGREAAVFTHELPDISNEEWSPNIKERIEKFMAFIKPKQHSANALEIISSILYLHKLGLDEDLVLKLVENKKVEFTRDQCIDSWDYLHGAHLIPRLKK